MNWKMIPFTELPPIETLTWVEVNVRSALLGACAALLLSPLIAALVWWRHSR